MKLSIRILSVLGLALSLSSFAHANTETIDWPSRNSKVVCGGRVDGEDLKLHIVTAGEIMGGESVNGRILLYVDLHKAGQAHLLISDALTDAEYDKRQAILAKLSPEDAELFQKITKTRVIELYSGFIDGIVQFDINYADRSLSLSCQEIAN